MSDAEKIKLLASDGMLVKRPILISDNGILIGFKEKEWSDFFLIILFIFDDIKIFFYKNLKNK